ncbi:2-nitropropane dioxygenase [Plantactinospora sp. BC1]|uniref:NAD(P)H-dependent flavin oxidoreductase n=1 Tax=Plantactinospora sp. BC1 TaxID=2108470 RepID=UPI000D17730C|nr:nitronate monooxygenase [Plantactinospora sp. BC1]AVT30002.1 2-nitropropane dioxygenase [Plantactinospora sp. BC1]
MNGLTTALCRRLGITAPVVQAPIGSAATPELAAAVCTAGGLGTLALTWVEPERARDRIRQLRRLTDRPFGVNLVLDFPVTANLATCLDEDVPIVSTFWGDPAEVRGPIEAAGALHFHTVGSVPEARRAAEAGVDVVVAQGWEAGGHVRGQLSTMALVPAVVDAVFPLPVVASGGIADGRGLAAVLALGAQAGWLGTRFVAATEAGSHEEYRRAVVAADAADAVHTTCFDGGWPGAPHRVLRNATLDRWLAAGSPPGPDRPGEGDVLATDAAGRHHLRYADMVPVAGMTGRLDELARYAGQSVGGIREISPAADIVDGLVDQAASALRRLGVS